jgi:hypothetical protein
MVRTAAAKRWPWRGIGLSVGEMNAFDVIKATLVCGMLAFLVYSFPVIGQVVIIGVLGLVWLSYVLKAVQAVDRK